MSPALSVLIHYIHLAVVPILAPSDVLPVTYPERQNKSVGTPPSTRGNCVQFLCEFFETVIMSAYWIQIIEKLELGCEWERSSTYATSGLE